MRLPPIQNNDEFFRLCDEMEALDRRGEVETLTPEEEDLSDELLLRILEYDNAKNPDEEPQIQIPFFRKRSKALELECGRQRTA